MNWLLENAYLFRSQAAIQNIFPAPLFIVFACLLIYEVQYYYFYWSQ